MKLIVRLYYLFFLLNGGFRSYAFEYKFFSSVFGGGVNYTIMHIIEFFVVLLMGIAAFNLLNPFKKYSHLLFFGLLFSLDILFQNKVRFTALFILIHLFPLVFYVFIQFKKEKELLIYGAILLVSVGYLTAFSRKIYSGWHHPDDLVIYAYLVQLNLGLGLNKYLADFFLSINNASFWKFADYLVLAFQGIFALNFFTKRFFIILCTLACVFHFSILLILNIGGFYPYMLFYSFIIAFSLEDVSAIIPAKINWKPSLFFPLIILVVSAVFSSQFFFRYSPLFVYEHRDMVFNILSGGVFLYFTNLHFRSEKTFLMK